MTCACSALIFISRLVCILKSMCIFDHLSREAVSFWKKCFTNGAAKFRMTFGLTLNFEWRRGEVLLYSHPCLSKDLYPRKYKQMKPSCMSPILMTLTSFIFVGIARHFKPEREKMLEMTEIDFDAESRLDESIKNLKYNKRVLSHAWSVKLRTEWYIVNMCGCSSSCQWI